MNADTLLENLEILADAPNGISRLRLLIIELAIHGRFSEAEKKNSRGFPLSWDTRPASEYFKSRSGNSKLIKGKLFNEFAEGRFAGYSASGQDVWLNSAEHSGDAAILSAVGARCGKAFRASGSWSAIANTHIIWLNDKRVEPDYGMLILNNETFWIRSGSAQPFVKVKASLEQTIGIPPLAEQKRLVAKVDELMTLCDQLEERKNQRDNIRTTARESAINAISTAQTPEELDAAWKRINNNWEVIADTLESINSLRELVLSLGTRIGFGVDIQRIPKQKLNEVSHVSWGNLSLTKTSYVEEGQFLAISAAGPDGRIGHAEHDKYTPVISAIGARCGTMFMPDERFTAIKNTMTVTPDRKMIDNWFLFYALKGSQLPRRGTAQPFLSKTDIENFEITVPSSLEDQRVIVAKIDGLMSLCDKLEAELKVRSEVAEKFARSVVSAA